MVAAVGCAAACIAAEDGSRNELLWPTAMASMTLALFASPDLETTLAVLDHSLKEDFGVPEVAARFTAHFARLFDREPVDAPFPAAPAPSAA